MKSLTDWVAQLNNEKLVNANIQLPINNPKSPWYLRVFSGFCGWLASWFLLGFLGLSIVAEVLDSTLGLISLGAVLISAGYAILKQKGNEFVEQMGLATSLAGQLFVCIGLFKDGSILDVFPLLLFTLLHVSLAVVMPNYLHRLLSAYFAAVVMALLLSTLHISSLFSTILLLVITLIWLNEFTFTRQVSAFQAIGYGLTVGLIQFKTSMLFSSTNIWTLEEMPVVNAWVDEGLNTLVLLFVIYLMLKKHKLVFCERDKWIAAGLLLLLLVANLFANGIVCGVAILLLGFSTYHRALSVLGVVAIIVNLSSYYYLVNLSLLHKSVVLMATGLGCALIGLAWQKIPMTEVKDES